MANEDKLQTCEKNDLYYDNDSIQFTDPLHDLIVDEGNDAVLECKVEGYPPPKCFWYKNGKLIKSNKKIKIYTEKNWQRLEILSAEPNDHGLYNIVCKTDSSVKTAKANLYVTKSADDVIYTAVRNDMKITKHLSDVRINEGESIYLEATINTEADINYSWYKNGKVLNDSSKEIINQRIHSLTLIINSAKVEDTGIYCIIAKTEYGVVSSFANVQVFDNWKTNNNVNDHSFHTNEINDEDECFMIQDHLPEEIEANGNEDIRLICVAKTDFDTEIEWFKDKKVLNGNSVPESYGHNYIGLKIKQPTKNDTGVYSVVLRDKKTGKVDNSSCFVTVNASPINFSPPVIGLKNPLQSAIGCYGSKIVFDCSFEDTDLKYFYVVWYIGHYRIERSNSRFSVICKDGNFLLYIKKLETDMTGEVICELRKAYSCHKAITINSSGAYLTVVPPKVLEDEKNNAQYKRGRIYWGSAECYVNHAHTVKEENAYGISSDDQTDILLDITYCRLEEDGYYYLYATRRDNLIFPVRVFIRNKQGANVNLCTVIIEWQDNIPPNSVWYKVEYYENNKYYVIGLTSQATFELECPPVGKMMLFRITKIRPMEECCEYHLSIAPSLERLEKPVKNYELKPMELFEKEYTKTGDIIGCGAFGSVTLVKDAVGQYLAAKIVKTRTQKKRDTAVREYEMMKKLKHPKLVELIDAYVAKDSFVFIMDYLWGGELFDRIVEEENIKEVDVVPYVRQICEALQYLHQNKIAHLDLKPENIICLNPNSGQVKIIDFGLARVLVEGNVTRAIYGTRDYVAPEVLNFESLTLACDMWSLGVVTYMLLSGVMPFAGDSWPERSSNIIMANYNYEETAFSEISDLAKDFVDQLLVLEANKRLSAEAALKHKWILKGPPKGIRAGHMKRTRENLKSYLANYRARWQRAGNVMIAALRLRTHANTLRGLVHQTLAPCVS